MIKRVVNLALFAVLALIAVSVVAFTALSVR